MLRDNPVIDEIVLFPRERFRGIGGTLASIPWSLRLRKIRPDIALDLQGLLRSALMARLSRAGRAIGISDAREGAARLYHQVIPVIRDEHAVLRYLRILGGLGLPKIERPAFPLPPGVPLDGPFRNQPFVVLHPFARGEGKSLKADHVVQTFGAGFSPQCPGNGIEQRRFAMAIVAREAGGREAGKIQRWGVFAITHEVVES